MAITKEHLITAGTAGAFVQLMTELNKESLGLHGEKLGGISSYSASPLCNPRHDGLPACLPVNLASCGYFTSARERERLCFCIISFSHRSCQLGINRALTISASLTANLPTDSRLSLVTAPSMDEITLHMQACMISGMIKSELKPDKHQDCCSAVAVHVYSPR